MLLRLRLPTINLDRSSSPLEIILYKLIKFVEVERHIHSLFLERYIVYVAFLDGIVSSFSQFYFGSSYQHSVVFVAYIKITATDIKSWSLYKLNKPGKKRCPSFTTLSIFVYSIFSFVFILSTLTWLVSSYGLSEYPFLVDRAFLIF